MEVRRKILMITKWYPNREDPQLGVFIQKHAEAISIHDDIQVLYLHSTDELNITECVISGNSKLKEIIVYYRKGSGKIFNAFYYLLALKKGFKEIRKNNFRPEIYHAYILTRPGIIAWLLSFFQKKPYLISEQWSGFITGKYLKERRIKKFITRYIVKNASAVTSVSHFLKNRMNESGLKNNTFKIIPNVIEQYNSSPVNISNNSVYVLLVADLVDEIKNVSGVIKMISRVETEISFVLHIIGRGPDENMLRQLTKDLKLEEKIFFEGIKTNAEVYSYLQRCDFLVMNSRYETFSLICAEAMSCGKPVLATRCGGPNEFVTSENGILIDPDNENELKKNFLFMLKNFRAFNSEKIMNHSHELFSKEKISKAFHDLYNSILISE
jgi:glycosyltransferase involved in cell wall biosynthesis